MTDQVARRDQLRGYLAKSRTVQRRMRWLGAGGLAVGLALLIVGAGAPQFLLVAGLPLVVAGAGMWITWGHITDFEKQLAGLTGSRRAGGPR